MSWLGSMFGGGGAGGSRVSGAEARKMVAEQGAQLVDVRTPAEFHGGHIDGSINVPVQELPGGASAISRDKPVIVFCRSGARSARAAAILGQSGFENVYDMGSVTAW